MTTAAQVKPVVKPLLARNADLALVGRLVVVKPVHHILRGVSIAATSDPLDFRPMWFVTFLFEPFFIVSVNWGQQLYDRAYGPWLVTNPATPDVMCDTIEREALPLLRPIQTIDDFVAFASRERFPHTYLNLYPLRKVYVDAARGDFASADATCDYLTGELGQRRYADFIKDEYEFAIEHLVPLIAARDRAGIARLLGEIESESARKLKLGKLWTPTPFPVEQNQAG